MQLFSNNASSTLFSGITDTATTMYIQVADANEFTSPSSIGTYAYELLTITDGTNIEIVKCTARSSSTLTIVRAQEGTTARAWSAGATVEARVTKGTLQKMAQKDYSGGAAISIGAEGFFRPTVAGAMPPGVLAWTANSNYAAVDTQFYAIQGADTVIMKCVKAGTSGEGQPPFNAYSGTVQDGTVVWEYHRVGDRGVAIGAESQALGVSCVAIGSKAEAGATGVAIGQWARSGSGGIAIGNFVRARHDNSIMMGTSCSSILDDAVHFARLGALGAYPDWMFGAEAWEYAGFNSYLQSEPMDLAGGSAWAATTAYKHGTVVRPTTPNGAQYVRWCNNYNLWEERDITLYTPGLSGSTEPTWPTVFSDSVTDGDGDWICIPHNGDYTLYLPTNAYMLVEEIGFIAYEASGITVQPTISIGTTGNLTKIASAQTTSGLTANMTAWKYVPSQPLLVPDLTIKIDTLATGTKLLGRFHFKGVLTKHWL